MSDQCQKVDGVMNPDKNMTDVELFELLVKSSNSIDGNIKIETPDNAPRNQLKEDCLIALSLFKERVLKDDEYTSSEKDKFTHMFQNLSLYCNQKASDDILSQILNTLKKGSECLEVNEVIETIFYSVLPQVNGLQNMVIPISKSVEKLIDILVEEISFSNTCAAEACVTHEVDISPASPKELKVEIKEHAYREPESWTDDESNSSSSSGSDFSLEELRKSSPVKIKPLRTKGEIDIEDLPPVEDLTISVKEEELRKIGKLHGIVGKLVVVKALKDEAQRPLNVDSVLFLNPHKPLGRIFEVFGPVCLPFYTVLFNTIEDINNKGIIIGSDVYYCPEIHDMTTYVFVDDLRKQKGSDASWMDNNEPPDEFLDYSDDEQERAAKLKRRAKSRTRNDEKEEEDDIKIISNKVSCVDPKISGTNNAENYQKKNYFGRKGNFSQPSVYNHSSEMTTFAYSDRKPISNRSSPARSTQSLEDVPVWISSPPTFLLKNEPQPVQAQYNQFSNNNPRPLHSFQPSSSQPHYVHPSSTQPQYFQPPSSQAYLINVPISQPSLHHPANINQQVMPQHQFAHDNFIPPPRPPQQQLMQPNIPRPFNGVHTFGQITPISAVSPMPPSPIFRPSPVLLVAPPNQIIPTSMISSTPPPVMSPNPYWQQREHLRSPIVHVQSPPQNAQFNMQNPIFPNMPPSMRFTPVNNFPMSQPRHTHFTNFSFSEPTYRF